MELHKIVNATQRNLINDAAFALAKFGEADGRIKRVAELSLTFQAIMDVVQDLYRVTSAIKASHVSLFRRTLHQMRRTSAHFSAAERREIAMMLGYVMSGTDTGRMTSDHMQTRVQVPTDDNGMCYPRPNGGHRILPSIYTRIKQWWMRANGVTVPVQDMNDGHLQNTMKLLQESHGNVIAKSTLLLGKMANHFHNDPYIVQDLEALCRRMQTVEVDDMYPIFNELAEEAAQRKAIPCMLTAVNPAWFDDGALNWDDK